MSDAPVDVAVGVLFDRDGRFLLAQRPEGKPMPGYWEFPGGKLEAGESVFDALAREFDEELGLHITAAHPWAQRVVTYPHATVRLHFWRSFAEMDEWRGEPESREGQAFRFERIDALTTEPWLQGAMPLRRWLQLPATYAISNAGTVGVDAFVERLEARIAAARVQQLQLREPTLDGRAFASLFDVVAERCKAAKIRLLVNSAHPTSYWARCDGVHFTARDLGVANTRPEVAWCLASCHDVAELSRAAALGADAAVVGSVSETTSHPRGAILGWDGFARIASTSPIPVYAIGGLATADLPNAIAHGAHGIAAIRSAWSAD